MSLRDQLADAEATAVHLRQRIAAETSCAVRGHRWRSLGGCNAGCSRDCACSVPVHECEDCGDCDYGENAEGETIRARCAAEAADGAASETGEAG